ncbi:MAG: hypothetical protein WA814_00290 [Candidatus Baltobacteraceae bacterium]
MSRLRDQTSVACPFPEAQSRLEAFFASLRAKDGVARLRLRVPIKGPADAYDLSIDRAVRVEAQRARDEENLNDLIRIAWQPEGTTVFPCFEGTLVVWGGDDPNRSSIELDGSYSPPFGAAGQLFDASIGRQIANATARALLRDLKDAIEQRAPRR